MTEQIPPVEPSTPPPPPPPPIEPAPDTSWVTFDLVERNSGNESETRSGD